MKVHSFNHSFVHLIVKSIQRLLSKYPMSTSDLLNGSHLSEIISLGITSDIKFSLFTIFHFINVQCSLLKVCVSFSDCMECMACSDNVVRAGLTPKFKDVDTLCEMLDYKCGTKEENIFPCHHDPSDTYVTIYDPPVPDFAVARIQVS